MKKAEIHNIIDKIKAFTDRKIFAARKFPIMPGAAGLNAWRLITIYSGTRTFQFSDGNNIVEHTLKAGDIIVKEPFSGITASEDEAYSILAIMCWRKSINCFIKQEGDKAEFLFYADGAIFEDLQLLLRTIFQLSLSSGKNILEPLLSVFLDKCEDYIMQKTTVPIRSAQYLLSEMFYYINNNLDQPLSCRIIGERFKVSENYVTQLFIREAEQSFNSYILSARLDLAQFMLLNSSMNINEISNYCGFNYPNYFIRVFKKNCNCTPREYRIKYSVHQ